MRPCPLTLKQLPTAAAFKTLRPPSPPTRIPANALAEFPSRTNWRTEAELPIATQLPAIDAPWETRAPAATLTEEPSRPDALIDKELPHTVRSTTDKLAANLVALKTDRRQPKRAKPETDTLLPISVSANTLRDLPIAAEPQTETLLPNLLND